MTEYIALPEDWEQQINKVRTEPAYLFGLIKSWLDANIEIDDVIVTFEGQPVVGRPISVHTGWQGDQYVVLPSDFAVPAPVNSCTECVYEVASGRHLSGCGVYAAGVATAHGWPAEPA